MNWKHIYEAKRLSVMLEHEATAVHTVEIVSSLIKTMLKCLKFKANKQTTDQDIEMMHGFILDVILYDLKNKISISGVVKCTSMIVKAQAPFNQEMYGLDYQLLIKYFRNFCDLCAKKANPSHPVRQFEDRRGAPMPDYIKQLGQRLEENQKKAFREREAAVRVKIDYNKKAADLRARFFEFAVIQKIDPAKKMESLTNYFVKDYHEGQEFGVLDKSLKLNDYLLERLETYLDQKTAA